MPSYCTDALLKKFVSGVRSLYGERAMSFNVHQILHLSKAAEQHGPLWAHSAFVFEGGNGRLVKTVNAAKGVPLQIVERVVLLQQVNLLLNTMPLATPIKQVCREMFGDRQVQHSMCIDGGRLLGHSKVVTTFSAAQQEAFNLAFNTALSLATEFHRVIFNGNVLHSQNYKRPAKSNTTVVQCKDEEYVRIERIFVINQPNEKCVLLCRNVVLTEQTGSFPHHIKECFLSPQNIVKVVEPQDIIASCLFIDFPSEKQSYVCDIANMIERD